MTAPRPLRAETTSLATNNRMYSNRSSFVEQSPCVHGADEQTRGLLQTVHQIAGQLDDARSLRRQKSGLFSELEKRMFDDSFRHAEEAICQVASLAERPSRGDGTAAYTWKIKPRVLCLLQNSPNIQVSLSQLGVASQGLNSTIVQLSSRGSRDRRPPSRAMAPRSPPVPAIDTGPPPTYDESVRQFLSQGRRRNMARRASAMSLTPEPLPSPPMHSRTQSTSSAPTFSTTRDPPLGIAELAAEGSASPCSMPLSPKTDLDGLPSQQRRPTYQLSPDLSIPEVVQPAEKEPFDLGIDLKPTTSRQSSTDGWNDRPTLTSTPLGRDVQGGRRTGRARSQMWLESRALR